MASPAGIPALVIRGKKIVVFSAVAFGGSVGTATGDSIQGVLFRSALEVAAQANTMIRTTQLTINNFLLIQQASKNLGIFSV
jgi:hypothetical protein